MNIVIVIRVIQIFGCAFLVLGLCIQMGLCIQIREFIKKQILRIDKSKNQTIGPFLVVGGMILAIIGEFVIELLFR